VRLVRLPCVSAWEMDTRRFAAVAWLDPVHSVLSGELMRRVCVAILVCAALGGCSGSRARDASSAEKAAIQAVLDAHAKAWNNGDAAAAAAVMTEDADWVSGDGSAGPAKGSWHTHPGLPKFHFIRADVAIVDGDSNESGLHDEQGKEIPAGVTRFTAVMVKEGGRWKVAAFRSLPQVKSKINAADVR
jgi:ketosteroid isomerase-like protein